MIRSTAARNIILGTSSSTRKAIASEMGFKFNIVKADIDERALGDRSSSAGARDLVLLLAKKKAQAILAKLTAEQKASSKILLTADQVVTHKGKILEKPTNKDEARAFITGYGQDTSIPCATVGSCVLTDVYTGKQVAGVDVAQIFFDQSVPRQTAAKLGLVDEIQDPADKASSPAPKCTFGEVSDRLATKLIDEGDVFYCAGGLMVEHESVNPFVRIQGTIESVMGLSPDLLASLWDTWHHESDPELSRKRKLESELEPQPKSKPKAGAASAVASGSSTADSSL